MTSMWKSNSRVANNLSNGLRREDMNKAATTLARVNAQRVKCAHCPLMILPADMARHVEINHEEQDDG